MHGVQHESPVRSASRAPAPTFTGLRNRSRRTTEPDHGDVIRRAQQQSHGLWKGTSWQELPRHDQGDPLHDLVCRSIPGQPKAPTCALPGLHPTSRGEARGGEEPLLQTNRGNSEQSQGKSQDVAGASSRESLGRVRRGDGDAIRGLVGHYQIELNEMQNRMGEVENVLQQVLNLLSSNQFSQPASQ